MDAYESTTLLLKQKSRKICIIGAAVLYVVYIAGSLGDGYAANFFFIVATVFYLVFTVIFYLPARLCIENYLNPQKKKNMRIISLCVILVPYIVCILFFSYLFADTHIFSTPVNLARRAADTYPHYQSLYEENAELLNRLNDEIWNSGDKNETIYQICTYAHIENGGQIRVEMRGGDRGVVLLSDCYLPDALKEEIRTLMQSMGAEEHNLSFSYNQFIFDSGKRVQVWLTKGWKLSESSHPEANLPNSIQLGDDWVMDIYIADKGN